MYVGAFCSNIGAFGCKITLDLLLLIICLLSFSVNASQRAVTDEGNIVILNSNGTWEYNSPSTLEKKEIKTNPITFKKSPES